MKGSTILFPVKRVQYIKCYSWTRTRYLKNPSNSYKSSATAGLASDVKAGLAPDAKSPNKGELEVLRPFGNPKRGHISPGDRQAYF